MIFRGVIYLGLLAAVIFCGGSAAAQIKIIPREKIDSVANPQIVDGVKLLFQGGEVVSFGTISEDDERWEQTILWQNGGQKDVVITAVRTSCSCLKAQAPKGVVKSGAKSQLQLSYYPKGHPGKVSQRVFVYTNLSSSIPSAVVTLKGEVLPSKDKSGDYPCRMGELLLRRDTVALNCNKAQTERIACLNSGSRAMRLTADSLMSSRGLSLRTEPEVLPAGGEGDLIISYSPEKNEKRPLWLKLYIKGLALPLREREIFVKIESEENKN